MVTIAITGNIGSGKSAVAHIIRDAGHIVVSSDDVAKRLTTEDAGVVQNIKQRFGDDAYNSDGSLNNYRIAEMVFGDSAEHHKRLLELNRIVHPKVLEDHERQIEQHRAQGKHRIFIESALIFEAELEDAFDYVVVVDAPEETRLKRLMQREAASEKAIRSRMKEQISSEQKCKLADFVVDNSSTPEALEKTIAALLPILEILPPRDFENDADEVSKEE